MADFNAGSIEGTLDVDTDPFVRGLRLAKLQAQEWEARSYTATLKTQYETEGDAPDEDADDESRTATTTIDADDSKFRAKMSKAEARLVLFGDKRTSAKVDADTSKATASIHSLSKAVDDANGSFDPDAALGGGGSSSGGGKGLLMLVGLAAALAPAFGPAIPALALFATAAVAAFSGAAASLLLYAGVLKGAVKTLTEANAAGIQLSGWAGKAQASLKGLTDAWGDLVKAASPGIFQLLTKVFGTMERVIPKLLPLINGISTGLMGAFEPIAHVLDGGQFERFIALLASNAVKDLPLIGEGLANGLSGMMSLFTALNPLIQAGLRGAVKLSAQFEKWARLKAPAFIERIMDMLDRRGPPMLRMLGSVFKGLGNVIAGFEPLIGPASRFLERLGQMLQNIDLKPLARGFGDILDTVSPLLPKLGELVNDVLPLLGSGLTKVAEGLQFFIDHPDLAAAVAAVAVSFMALSKAVALLAAAPALLALLNPVTLTIAALALLAGGLVYAYRHSKQFREAVNELRDAIADKVLPIVERFANYVNDTLWPALKDVAHIVRQNLKPIFTAFADVLEDDVIPALKKVQKKLDEYWPAMVIYLEVLGELMAATIAYSTGYAGIVIPAFTRVWGFLFGIFAPALVTAIELVIGYMSVIAAMGAMLPGVVTAYGQFVTDVVLTLGSLSLGITAAFDDAADWLIPKGRAIIRGLIVGIVEKWPDVKSWFSDRKGVVKGFFTAAEAWLTGPGRHIITGLWQGIKEKWADVKGWFVERPAAIKGFFDNAADWLDDKGRAILRGLLLGITTKWTDDIKPWLDDVPAKVKGAVPDLAETLYNSGWALISGFWDGIKDRFAILIAGVAAKLAELAAMFPKSPAKTGPFSGRGYTLYSGQALMEGFAQGIRDRSASAVDAARATMAEVAAALLTGPPSLPRLAVAGGPAARQAQVMQDGLAEVVDEIRGIFNDPNRWGDDEKRHGALLRALDRLGGRVEQSDIDSVTRMVTTIRKG